MARNLYVASVAVEVPFYTVHSIYVTIWNEVVVKNHFFVCSNTFLSISTFRRCLLAVSEHMEGLQDSQCG